MHYIYILYSAKLGKFYIGYSADIRDRLAKHNRSLKGFTAAGKPWKLIYTEEFTSKKEALMREKQLKKWKNKERISQLIARKNSEHPGSSIFSGDLIL
jgi:putative endonuclease